MSQVRGRNVLHKQLLSEADREELCRVIGELGPDPTSKHFASRTKSIGFVLCIDGDWYQINRNYFAQAKAYNMLSGGFRRYYRELPREFIESPAVQNLLSEFKRVHEIPDGELILLNVQTSHVRHGDRNTCLTGHGIHTDGTDKAMLVCLARKNIQGCMNSFYADYAGNDIIMKPFELKAGHACFWEDNQIYHHVDPGEPVKGAEIGERTVLVANYPAKFFLDGTQNPKNMLQRGPANM